MLRLILIGFGGYGWTFVTLIRQVGQQAGCRLVAAADTRLAALADKAQELARTGVELFDDPLAMFESLRGRCEAAYIATGIASHAPLTIAAAKAGLHVHLEKPPAATVQEVDAMLDALTAAGRFCTVGFQALHEADILFVKDAVASGRLGRVRSLVCHAGWPRTAAYYARNDWAGKLRVGDAWVLDGPATNALAHQMTNMLFLASPEPNRLATPRSVRAELYAAGPVDSHDTAAIEINTVEGPTCLFLGSHCSEANFGPVIEIESELANVRWTMRDGARITYAGGAEESCPADDGRPKMVANFAEAIRRGDASLLRCPLGETRKFALALDGAHESSGCVHRIGPQHVRRVGEGSADARTIIAGLDALLPRAALERSLFSTLREPPAWVVPTEPFDLSDYRAFPQRFTAQPPAG